MQLLLDYIDIIHTAKGSSFAERNGSQIRIQRLRMKRNPGLDVAGALMLSALTDEDFLVASDAIDAILKIGCQWITLSVLWAGTFHEDEVTRSHCFMLLKQKDRDYAERAALRLKNDSDEVIAKMANEFLTKQTEASETDRNTKTG